VIAVSGLGQAVLGAADPLAGDSSSYLKSRKSRKFMGVQDELAVVAAGRALRSAGLGDRAGGERAGLYLAVGYIPFEEADLRPVLEASLEDGRFSMPRFAAGGYQKAHPLLTFRCLPNMPAYHVSASFDVQGPYVVTYPTVGQFALALEEAAAALDEGRIEVALVGGVAHQRNFLVEHHFARLVPPVDRERLVDAAAFLVLERAPTLEARGGWPRGHLESLSVTYRPVDPAAFGAHEEVFEVDGTARPDPRHLGPASLGLWLGAAWSEAATGTRVRHQARGADGVVATSLWTRAPAR
jgi:Beta-ketoacyl synthase, N-terminal domain